MKLAVTGSASFIGEALCRLCRARGVIFAGLDAAPREAADTAADILDPALASFLPPDADAIVHLAAISRDADCRRDPHHALEVNLLGTLNVARAARAAGIRQLIFASSEWVYGETGAAEVDESTPIDANRIGGEYALSKLAGERLLAMNAREPGLAVTVLRFGIVYGPRASNWSAVESLADAARKREEIQVGSASTARRFVHVDDIARGILAAAGQAAPFEVFNLTGDRLVPLGEVIRTAAELAGRAVRVVETGPRQASVRNAANRRAGEVLGWRPAIDLRAGLASLYPEWQTARAEESVCEELIHA